MLAGLPQNPALANPLTNLGKATTRQHLVLVRMRDTGVISEAQYQAARAEKLQIRSLLTTEVHAEHVAEMARRAVVDRFGEKAYTEGVKVYTSLVAADQRAAHAALSRGLMDHERKQAWRGPEDHVDLPDGDDEGGVAQALKEYKDDDELRLAIVLKAEAREVVARLATGETVQVKGDGLRWAQAALSPKAPDKLRLVRGAVIRLVHSDKSGWSISQWPEVQGGFVSLDPATGRVRALVGGFDFMRQPFNHVTQAWRQPGSTFKPFLYSAALEHGIMPGTLINDAALTLGDWSPQNSDGQFDGPMTMRQALARSRNLVSVRLVRQMGVADARQWTTQFGFEANRQPDNLTLALGAGATTPLQLALGYAVFANGGYRVLPRLIERITDAQDKPIYEAPAVPPLTDADAATSGRVIPARNAFLIRSLLQEVTRSGTAARAQAMLRRPDLYGKTGTTSDAVDAWFAGFQPGVVAVVWIGYDEPRSLGSRESGGGLALPVWIQYMDKVLRGVPVRRDVPPDGVVGVDGDWRYAEFAEGGFVYGIDVEEAPPAAAALPATSASEAVFAAPEASPP